MTTPKQPATEARYACEWCGAALTPAFGCWTAPDGTGDYCPEGRAVGVDGTSPHKPAETAAGLLALREALTAIRDAATSVRVRQMAEAALADTAPAAAEIEARIEKRALRKWAGFIAVAEDAERQGVPIHVATRETCAEHLAAGDDSGASVFTKGRFLDLASPEAEQRLAKALAEHLPAGTPFARQAPARILAALREQPATDAKPEPTNADSLGIIRHSARDHNCEAAQHWLATTREQHATEEAGNAD